MQTDSNPIQVLFSKYVKGEASPAETEHLFQLIGADMHDEEISLFLASELEATEYAVESDPACEATWNKIKIQAFDESEAAPKRGFFKLWPRIAIVAAALVSVLFGIYFFNDERKAASFDHLVANDIAPGKVGATLTLANGKRIRLGNAANGEIAKESGISISKTADGQIVYEIKSGTGNANVLNTLSTSKGETYVVTLPDQSKVWLNASSSLTYTTGLTEQGVRKIRLSGEAYFEVFKDPAHAFVVESGNQQVEVLGTHFNVNAYDDENNKKTTLLEGSVKVSFASSQRRLATKELKDVVLSPGQQSSLQGETLRVSQADIEEVMAWKNGDFIFKDESIESIMRIVSRWYNVDVVFEDELTKKIKLGGFVSRSKNISAVLTMMELTKRVQFKVAGRKIIVQNVNN
ncbi:DUF4974 domain-containing protein [Pedobacter sp. MC2016-14]|uniref:FecR family protein n=1 Tax=Pedobacter sp. MC2016-14 TaxID=2897327 RepID=UPI001E4CD641|nr:FecR family protein [Pedobacter sp. MC2016-14]MCD0490496.1 DUF4974 domain-containing protein [Pedobacter sp. MC2016-14]